MPNRLIKESICTSDNLNLLSAFQETFFFRLIVNCDDYGRMDARPKILSSRLYPLKEIRTNQIEDALRALSSAELVTLYTVGGKPFLQMKTWNQHQRVRDSKEKYPGPEEADENDSRRVAANCGGLPRVAARAGAESESNPNPNPNPNPSICAELNPAPAAMLPLVDGTQYSIPEEDAEKDRQAYPAIDVDQEYLKMGRWLDANPAHRKTRKGIRRFINSWLGRAQDQARPGKSVKMVSAQCYEQRPYTEKKLLEVSDDLIAEARRARDAENKP